MTATALVAALSPHRNDVEVIRAALAYLIALLAAPFVRIRQAAAEARLERLAVQARRSALLAYSPSAGFAPIPLASVPVALPVAGVIDAIPPAPPACHEPLAVIDVTLSTWSGDHEPADVIDVAEPTAPAVWHVGEELAAPPAVIDPPAAPAKRTRKTPSKPTSKQTTTAKAANKPTSKRTTKAKAAPAVRFPSIKDVAAILSVLKSDLEVTEDDDDNGIDVRLQVVDGSWDVLCGDAQYDTDHRGFWGAGYLTADTNVRDLARDLISEAKDDHAQQ